MVFRLAVSMRQDDGMYDIIRVAAVRVAATKPSRDRGLSSNSLCWSKGPITCLSLTELLLWL